MNNAYLSKYFSYVGAKRLTAVEVDLARSNQHEFNASDPLMPLFGTEKLKDLPVKFIYIDDDSENSIAVNSYVTWYDSRKKDPTRSAEYRLYFKDNDAIKKAGVNDMIYFAKKTDNSFLIIIAADGSTTERQLTWLLGIPGRFTKRYGVAEIRKSDKKIDITASWILNALGIEPEETETDLLDNLLLKAKYDRSFPSTSEFSTFARNTLVEAIDPIESPDHAIMQWMNWEEKLFKRLEHKIIEERLKRGFDVDNIINVDNFIQFSLSVQNRRKARAGFAFENHLQTLFHSNDLRNTRTAVTENKSKPDFIFPHIGLYMNPLFKPDLLTMLGVKTTCKDRWRQILSEAKRIDIKHLLTLEPGISENQTDEMKEHKVQLILPSSLHESYLPTQKPWLYSVADFIALAKKRQVATVQQGFLLSEPEQKTKRKRKTKS
jgi:hypothetical protein